MIPLTFLCDEYIDRPRLNEQKNPFEYIVPPLYHKCGRNNEKLYYRISTVDASIFQEKVF